MEMVTYLIILYFLKMKDVLFGLEGSAYSILSLSIKNYFGISIFTYSNLALIIKWEELLNSSLTAFVGAVIGFTVHLTLKHLYKKFRNHGKCT